jgi:hypothetical protein
MANCTVCEAAIPPDEVVYNTSGDVLCLGCHKLNEWSAQIGRAAASSEYGYSSGRPPVVHPVTACAGCGATLVPGEAVYSLRALKQRKPKVFCAACDKKEFEELEAIAREEARQGGIIVAVVAALAVIGGLVYYFVIAPG